MICVNCKKEIRDDLKFCPHCGSEQSFEKNTVINKPKRKTGLIISVIAITVILSIFGTCFSIPLLSKNNSSTNATNNKALLSINEKQNKQIQALTILDREIPFKEDTYYTWTLTNDKKYVDSIYYFEEDPNISDSTDFSEFENNFLMKWLYEYDNKSEKNLLVSEYNKYFSDEDALKEQQYEYVLNEDNHIEVYKESLDDEYGYDCSIHSFFTYENNDIVQKSTTNYDEDTETEVTYTYDEDGYLSLKTVNTNTYTFYYEKDNNNNIVSVKEMENAESVFDYEYEYDDNQLIEERIYSSVYERELSAKTNYTYDPDGNIISIKQEKYENGEVSESIIKNYEYDENNNVCSGYYEMAENNMYFIVLYNDSPNLYEVYNSQ